MSYKTLVGHTRHWWDVTVECCWLSYNRKDITKLERAQRWFSRIFPELEGLSYREKLSRLWFWSLECRSLMGDLTEVHKIMTSLDKENAHSPRKGTWELGGWEGKDKKMHQRGHFFPHGGRYICETSCQKIDTKCWINCETGRNGRLRQVQ